MDGSSKVTVKIAVDRDLAAEAQTAGLDLEEVVESALRRTLGRPALSTGQTEAERIEAWRREHADAIAWRNEIIDRDGFFGEEWRSF